MGLKTWIAMAGAAVAGIYLTSEEGKKAREALKKKKSTFEPIIKDLLKQANEVLDGTKKINSEEIRANVELLVNEAKNTLVSIDLEKTVDTIKDAIQVASKKIRVASNDAETQTISVKKVATKPVAKKPTTTSKTTGTKKPVAKKTTTTKKVTAKK